MVTGAPRSTPNSSRHSDAGAGWGCAEPSSLRPPEGGWARSGSWLDPRVLWRARNDWLARISDPVADERARWVGDARDEDLVVDLSRPGRPGLTFLLMGDTGEGDRSQYALVPALRAAAPGADLLMICSDVLYPAGDVNDYATKFYTPYAELPLPIYAVPGNHDWYDGLAAFMYHFCGRDRPAGALPPPRGRGPGAAVRRWIRLRLWRRPGLPLEATGTIRLSRDTPAQRQPVRQPGPYYVIDTDALRIVCVDTGIAGTLDEAQGRWLLRVSRDPRPKILLTGKPLYVDGEARPCAIDGEPEGFASVLAVTEQAAFRYRAVIGGDVHNYQRYPVRAGGTVVQHVVSGGGGAFMHATHLIGEIDPEVVPGVHEDDFRLYPLRRDSLAAYSRVLSALGPLRHLVRPLSPDEAQDFITRRTGMPPIASRPLGPVPEKRVRRAGAIARSALLMGRGRLYHKLFSPFYDWDDPPFFKHFLRVEVTATTIRIECHAVTGCGEGERAPRIEDSIEIDLAPAP